MKNLTKLGIALILAIAAAILNAVYLYQASSFVKIKTATPRGEPIAIEQLSALQIPDSAGVLKQSLVPWEDRNLLLQLRSNRDFKPGDVVLQRDVEDMLVIGSRKSEMLRFRVIAVGDRFKRQNTFEPGNNSSATGNTVTIAVKQPSTESGEFDLKTEAGRNARRMVSVVTRRMAGKDPLPEDRIYGVTVLPRVDATSSATQSTHPVSLDVGQSGLAPDTSTVKQKDLGESSGANGAQNSTSGTREDLAKLSLPIGSFDKESSAPVERPAKDEMALTISLEGVESVPAVILVGGEIGFYMYPEYPSAVLHNSEQLDAKPKK